MLHATSQFCCQPWKRAVQHEQPSVSPVTVVKLTCTRVRVPCIVAAAAIQGWCLVKEVRYPYYNVLLWRL